MVNSPSTIGYFRTYIDTLILGLRFPIGDLGAYNNMKYFASMPMLQFLTPLVAPLHREMGKVQHQREDLKFQFDITLKLLGFLIAPIAAIFYLSSEQIVLLVLGDQWVEYHRIFGFLGMMIIPFVLFTQTSRILMVSHLTRTIFNYEVIATALIAFFLFTLPASSGIQFSIYKVILELFLSSILFFYSYRKIFKDSGVASYIYVLFPFLTVVFLTGFSSSLVFETKSFYSLFLNCFLSTLFTLAIFSMFFYAVASEKERDLVRKVFGSLKN